MAAEQIGWLHSVPVQELNQGKKVPWKHNRFKQIAEIENREPEIVELDIDEERLFQALFDLGPTKFTSMGEEPLPWTEIWSWFQATLPSFYPFDLVCLYQMSKAYLIAKQQGENPLSIDPVTRDRMEKEGL